jgi:hypothetical protein
MDLAFVEDLPRHPCLLEASSVTAAAAAPLRRRQEKSRPQAALRSAKEAYFDFGAALADVLAAGAVLPALLLGDLALLDFFADAIACLCFAFACDMQSFFSAPFIDAQACLSALYASSACCLALFVESAASAPKLKQANAAAMNRDRNFFM